MEREPESGSINSTTSSNQLLGFRFDFLRYADAVLVKTLTAQFFVLLLIKRKYVNLYVETTSNMRKVFTINIFDRRLTFNYLYWYGCMLQKESLDLMSLASEASKEDSKKVKEQKTTSQ